LCTDDETRERVAALIRVDAAQYTIAREFFERNSHFLCLMARGQYSPRGDDQLLRTNIGVIKDHFQDVSAEKWNEENLKLAFDGVIENIAKKWGPDQNQSLDGSRQCRNAVQHFLRWALTGGRPGPALIVTMTMLGRRVSLLRIEDAANAFKNMTEEKS